MRPSILSFLFLAQAAALSLRRPHEPRPIARHELLEFRGKTSIIQRDGVERTVFEHEASGTKIDFVTNSGICETTKGVKQYSGYVEVGKNQSMWFWFFEARNNPKTAPLGLWLNGGPGCSSLIGMFQENGPCRFVDNSTTPTINPYSWNEYANMLYVDQPVSAGFSYGTDDVSSTVDSAPAVWKLLQAFFSRFCEYENRDFGLFTESYGGHYGPAFADYIEQQNKAIKKGTIKGHDIHLVALGINNGYYDAYEQDIQYPKFLANNTYYQIFNESIAEAYAVEIAKECLPAIKACDTITGKNDICNHANTVCGDADAKFDDYFPDVDFYDIRQKGQGTFPSTAFLDYLARSDVVKAIGAKTTFALCSPTTSSRFDLTGDGSRSFIPTLSNLVTSGLPTLIWAGDADASCDWFGGFAVVNKIQYPQSKQFQGKEVENHTTKGVVDGEFKNVGKLSWMRVFDAGHEIPAYKPELGLQIFRQMMEEGRISST